MPCQLCNDFRGHDDDQRKENRHHIRFGVSWGAIVTSATSCEVCDILVRGCRGCFNQHDKDELQIKDCDIGFLYESHATLGSQSTGEEEQPTDVDKNIVFHFQDGRRFTVQVFVDEDEKYPVLESWESIPVSNQTSPGTDSDAALDKAKDWIDTCLSSAHKACKSPNSPTLPTRVVDVSHNDVVRVFEPGENATGSYLCLSHCWGSKQLISTTGANLTVHKTHGIRLEVLPQTFRDAALLTRRLGYDYIWIDSLCIVQDDFEDWKAESAKMAQVYRNAAITLAATKAHSSTDGLYTKSPTYCVTGNSMSSGEPYALFFRQKIDHHSENTTVLSGNNSIPGFVSHSTSEYHRLLTRAWVFQERLLSTRMLHFGPYELFFECCTDMQCECGGVLFLGSSEDIPLVMTKLLYTDAIENHDKRKKMRVVPSMAEGGTRSAGHWMARLWRTMVSSYMGLDITKPRDRLPAIGGLAQVLATKRTGTGADSGHSNYLAGLWLDTLSDDLLWIVYGGASLQPRPRTCDDLQCLSAPTWSWASVCDNTQYYDEIMSWHPDIWWFDGIVSERGRQPRHLAQIEACTVDLDGDDKGDDDKTGNRRFGLVSSGTLTVIGAVVECHLVMQTKIGGNAKLGLLFEGMSTAIGHSFYPDYILDAPGPDQVLLGAEVICLRMAVRPEGAVDYLVSLVLHSRPGSDHYERIGTFLIERKPPLEDIECGIFKEAETRKVVIQ